MSYTILLLKYEELSLFTSVNSYKAQVFWNETAKCNNEKGAFTT